MTDKRDLGPGLGAIFGGNRMVDAQQIVERDQDGDLVLRGTALPMYEFFRAIRGSDRLHEFQHDYKAAAGVSDYAAERRMDELIDVLERLLDESVP